MQKMFFMIVVIIEAIFSTIALIMLTLNSPFLDLFTDYAVAICAFFPVAAGFLLIKKYGIFNSLFGKCFSFLTAGLTLWFLGEFLWPIYSRVLNVEMPFPSLMDFLWMGGYIFIGIGVYIIFTIFKPNLVLKRLTRFLIIFLTLIVILAIIFLTPIIYYKASFLEQVIYCYYLIADIIILSLLMVVYRIFKGGEISKAWLILVLGIIVIFLADIFFNLATSINSEFYLSLGDLIYINGYSLTALGLIKHLMKL
jgi:hypothetical protein